MVAPRRLSLPLAFAGALGAGGCVAQPPSGDDALEHPVGQLQLRLTSQGGSGASYRLRDAVIVVAGSATTLELDTEEDPTRTSLTANVPVGHYSLSLQPGWRLERLPASGRAGNNHDTARSGSGGDSCEPVAANLLSNVPLQFEVSIGRTTRVPLKFRVGAAALGALEVALEVEEAPPLYQICEADSECQQGETCCISGLLGACTQLAEGQACPQADLTISASAAENSLFIREEYFSASSCALDEGCVDAPGLRRLLTFSTETPNIGEADMILGNPDEDSGFEFAECHNHYHFEGYADYQLLDQQGQVVASGHKQAFCLLDSTWQGVPGTPERPRFSCGFQGIQRGWTDAYGSNLDCQWVDITDVPSGDYVLRITINHERLLPESNYDNNVAELAVHIPPAAGNQPDEPCAVPRTGMYRECGFEFASGLRGATCTPGQTLSVGCCEDLQCSGDPVLRLCEGNEACDSAGALGLGNDACNACPGYSFTCPSSGVYSVLVGPFQSGDQFSCAAAVTPP